MKKILLSLLIFSIAVLVSGCASMFSEKQVNIPVKTTPENATISVYAGVGGKIFEGKSPCVILLNKKEVVSGKIIISLKGYKDTQIDMGTAFEESAIANFCLLPLFWVGVGIDFVSGNLFKPEVETINILLEPQAQKSVIKGTDSENVLLSQNYSLSLQRNGSEYMLIIKK